ncbi:hypothetical protein AYI68_g7459 [Smittium mucronatum]|uniref:Uncharacterized protein n=1 Tax=Smittium mucronatum TaxID=133383 RepID=A0A1R0GNM2_9FUNG|nr:hypothetical protein AYI68_g7459 [Smittium mucronatum]
MIENQPLGDIRLFTTRLSQKQFSSANKEASVFLKEKKNLQQGITHALSEIQKDLLLEISKLVSSPQDQPPSAQFCQNFLSYLHFLSCYTQIRSDLIDLYLILDPPNNSSKLDSCISILENCMISLLKAPRSSKWRSLYISLSSEIIVLKNLVFSNIHLINQNYLPFVSQIISAKNNLSEWKLILSLSSDGKSSSKNSLNTSSNHSNSLDLAPISDKASSSVRSNNSIFPKTSNDYPPSSKLEEKKLPSVFSKDWIITSMQSILQKTGDFSKNTPPNIDSSNVLVQFDCLENWFRIILLKGLIYFEGNLTSFLYYDSLSYDSTRLFSSNISHSRLSHNSTKYSYHPQTSPLNIFHDAQNLIWSNFPQKFNYLDLLDQVSYFIGADYITLIYEPPSRSKISPTGHNFFNGELFDPQFKVARTAILSFYHHDPASSTNESSSSDPNVESSNSAFIQEKISSKASSFLNNKPPILNSSNNSKFSNLDSLRISLPHDSKRKFSIKYSNSDFKIKNKTHSSKIKEPHGFLPIDHTEATNSGIQSPNSTFSHKNHTNNTFPATLPNLNSSNKNFIKGRINQYSSEMVPGFFDSSQDHSDNVVEKFRRLYLPDIVGAVLDLQNDLDSDFMHYYTSIHSQNVEPTPQKESFSRETTQNSTRNAYNSPDFHSSSPTYSNTTNIRASTDPIRNTSLYRMYSSQPHLRYKEVFSEDTAGSGRSISPLKPFQEISPAPSLNDKLLNDGGPASKSSSISNFVGFETSTDHQAKKDIKPSYNWLGLSSYFTKKSKAPSTSKLNTNSKVTSESNSKIFSRTESSKKPLRPLVYFKTIDNKVYLMAKVEYSNYTIVAVADSHLALSNSEHWFRLVDFIRGYYH